MSSGTDGFQLTALIPEGGGPITVFDNAAALRAVVASRADVRRIGAEWDIPGVYLLFEDAGAHGYFRSYVGKAPAGLISRVRTHVREKEGWERAILIARDTTHGFSSAQVAWLEGRLWSLINASEHGELTNSQQPRDETLPPYERAGLERLVSPIARLLHLVDIDVSPSTEPEEGETLELPPPARRKRVFAGTLTDLLRAGLLHDGQEILFTWTGLEQPGSIVVVGGEALILIAGATHKSPSGAGLAIRGGAVNGWSYFSTREADGGLITLGELRARLPEIAA